MTICISDTVLLGGIEFGLLNLRFVAFSNLFDLYYIFIVMVINNDHQDDFISLMVAAKY
jgi:hypothetical protein